MSKTAEEIYEERVEAATHGLVVEFLENAVEHLTVVEYLSEVGEDDGFDFVNDVHDSVNNELDTILQRWLDRDN